MERSVGQKLVGAFVVGGLIASFMQCIMTVVRMVLPVPALVSPVSLALLGLVGMVLVLNGSYRKLEEIGGFGAGIMFCGIVDAVSGAFMRGAMEEGGTPGSGTKAACRFAAVMLGSFVVLGIVLGLLLARTPGVLASMNVVAANSLDPGPIVFLYAFLVGGLFSAEGQALIELTPLPMPAVLLGHAALGMLLAILGVSTPFEVIAGAGLCATIVDAGAGAVLSGAAIVLSGTPMRAIVFVLLMVLVVVMGIICGNVVLKRVKGA
ncbi:MAG: SpoVA/SpoVAEb family sporulation membrane protein [Coriobacteriales bacterium]|nr:SpoVA/SpoVAEb family sporulation membrane protein [Coriobacteriales bacterium]